MISKTFVKSGVVKKEKKITLFSFILSILLIFVITAMVIRPEKYIAVSLNSLLVWSTVVLPAIFPFLLYSKFLTKLGIVDFFARAISPITKFLFHTEGISAYIYLVSIISGYPVGAKLTADLYEDGRMTRGNALRTITYSANSGPMFIVGTVGIGMFVYPPAGYVILISHLIGAIINGIVYRNYKRNDVTRKETKDKDQTDDDYLYSTAISSCNSMLVVGTYIVVFFILIEFLSSFFVSNNVYSAIFNGLLEITHGCQDLSLLNISMSVKIILATFLISFGGLSTTMQSLAFLKKMKFSTSFFILTKFTHAVFSTIICVLILLVFKV